MKNKNEILMNELAEFIRINGSSTAVKLISDAIDDATKEFPRLSSANCHHDIGRAIMNIGKEMVFQLSSSEIHNHDS